MLGAVVTAQAPNELPRTGSGGGLRLALAGLALAGVGVMLVTLSAVVRSHRTSDAPRH